MTPNKDNNDTPERRNDIGGKLAWFLVCAMLLGFAGVAWATAQRGGEKADSALALVNEDRQKIVRLETQFETINYRLEEIKALIKNKN